MQLKVKEGRLDYSIWKIFHFYGEKQGWDQNTWQKVEAPRFSVETEESTAVVPYGRAFELPITSAQITVSGKKLDGVTIGPPSVLKTVYNIKWQIDWDMAELGLRAGQFVDVHIRAALVRQEDDFPKFVKNEPGRVFIRASSVLESVTQRLSTTVNPSYRGWILDFSGFVQEAVRDWGIELEFQVDFEPGDVPPGWLNNVVFLTLRSFSPLLSLSPPGLCEADVWPARTCVGRTLAASPY